MNSVVGAYWLIYSPLQPTCILTIPPLKTIVMCIMQTGVHILQKKMSFA